MKLQQDLDHSTLSWVKTELDTTLKQAIEALETYSDDQDDSSQMRFCATYLHQVQGTLRMVELYGAAMMVEEMEHVAVALLDEKIEHVSDAFEILMRGMVQLPDYLDRLLSGYRDIPVVLLPLLNELRAVRNAPLVTEGALFNPNLEHSLPDSAKGPAKRYNDAVLKPNISKLRMAYQFGLLKWIKDELSSELFSRMVTIMERLQQITSSENLRQLWWVAGALLEALLHKSVQPSTAVKLLFGKLDIELKRFAEMGEAGYISHRPDALIRNMLYYLAQSEKGSKRVDEIKALYELEGLLPKDEEVEHAQGAMSGHNKEMLDSVAIALKEELMQIKEQLDLFLRRKEADPAKLNDLLPTLKSVRDTLGMLGVGYAHSTVEGQIHKINQFVAEGAAPDEPALLEIAGSLLTVESSLDDYIQSMGAEFEKQPEPSDLPKSEVRKILEALMKEASGNLNQAKQSLVSFIEAPWNHQNLEKVPALLGEVSGALQMLDLDKASALMERIQQYIQKDLLDKQTIPTADTLDALAESIAAMEYYMEAVSERRSGWNQVLDKAESAIIKLESELESESRALVEEVDDLTIDNALLDMEGDEVEVDLGLDIGLDEDENLDDSPLFLEVDEEPVEELDSGVSTPDWELEPLETEEASEDDLSSEASGDTALSDQISGEENEFKPDEMDQASEIPTEPAIDSTLDVPEAVLAIQIPEVLQDDADKDILEVFTEEMQEEIQSLQEQYPIWKQDLEQKDALSSIRRSFHTLKGSGRLVGALRTGEFSWKIENMLNRLIEEHIPFSSSITQLMDVVIDETVPKLFNELTGGDGPVTEDLQKQMYAADCIAKNEPVPEVCLQTDQVQDLSAFNEPEHLDLEPSEDEETEEITWDMDEPEFPSIEAENQTDHESVDESSFVEHDIRIDPELLEIFQAESETHLAVLNQYLEAAQQGEPPAVPEALRVAIHTLNGAASMTEVEEISQLTGPMEGYIKRLQAHNQTPDENGLSALNQASEIIPLMVAKLGLGEPLENTDLLRDQIVELRDCLPPAQQHEPQPPVEMSEELESAMEDMDDMLSNLVVDPIDETEKTASDHQPSGDLELDEFDFDTLDIEGAEGDQGNESDAFIEVEPEQLADLEDESEAESLFGSELNELPDESQAFAEIDAEDAGSEIDPESFDLEGFDLEVTDLETEPEPEEAEPEEAEPEEAEPEEAEPEEAEPEEAELEEADLEEADLEEADLEEVDLEEADLEEADLEEADLEEADLEEADLEEAEPEEAELEGAEWDGPDPFFANLDQEMIEIFLEESDEIESDIDRAMEAWRVDPEQRAHIDALQRSLHTIKGGARTVGLEQIADIAHQMESVFMALQQGEIKPSAECIKLETEAFDHMQEATERLRNQAMPVIDHDLLIQLRNLAKGIEAEPAEVDDQNEVLPFAEPQTPKLPDKALGQKPRSRTADIAAGQKQDLVRVRSDLLDNLVNFSGEVSIYRSRLEQQMGDFRFNLDEMEQTVSRLQDQLRKLEIETEAQILSRYQRESDTEKEDFDPLELDRFSTLQQLSRALSESVNDLGSIQEMMSDLTRESETLLLQQSRVSTELQEGLMRTRMVPFDSLVPRLRRIVRQTSSELGKDAQLVIDGAEREMDRNVLERITAPLEHMIRNAIAHGIEKPEIRSEQNKPETGTITIGVSRDGTDVVIRISDDGHGINIEKIRHKAIEKGLIADDAELSEAQLMALVMESGFSTVEDVSQIAGRGVGMDVVNTELKQLGGVVTIQSKQGEGSQFTIRLPFTLSVTQSIIVRAGDENFAIPLAGVEAVLRLPVEEYEELLKEENPEIVYGGREHAVHSLSKMLDLDSSLQTDMLQVPILITKTGDQSIALKVDGIVGNREVVVKSVGPQISSISGIFGATIMGDGSVLLILDVGALARRGVLLMTETVEPEAPIEELVEQQKPVVMVVDDSITMRKVTSRVLERQDMEVFTAKDGIDAVEQLQERQPDIMLLDIEMPRMDGYELATHMRNDERLAHIPIIMITSRTGEKHRQRAMDLGVKRYLGKPYQEDELLKEVRDCLDQYGQ